MKKVFTYVGCVFFGYKFEFVAISGYFQEDEEALSAALSIVTVRRCGGNGIDVMRLVAKHVWSMREPAQMIILCHTNITFTDPYTDALTRGIIGHYSDLDITTTATTEHYLFTYCGHKRSRIVTATKQTGFDINLIEIEFCMDNRLAFSRKEPARLLLTRLARPFLNE